MKKHGHYCKVCGEYKANEKFSGKGHAAHICKKCAALPADVRSAQMIENKGGTLNVRKCKTRSCDSKAAHGNML